MIYILKIAGILVVVGCIITAFASGGILGGIISIICGVILASVFFALSKILENQEIIISQLSNIDDSTKKPLKKITCKNCSKTYTSDYSSCPHCGRKSE